MRFLVFLLALPLSAQTLSLSCPAPSSFNQAAVCQAVLSVPTITPVVAALWTLTATPKLALTSASLVSSKSLSVGPTGIYMLSGVNKTTISGAIASITIPPHSGAVTLQLSQPQATSPTAHAVPISPGISVTVQ